MNPDWQFVLNETTVKFLLGCKAAQRELLLRALRDLAADPYVSGDYQARDETGRPVKIIQVGRYLITFWTDSFVKELRVINLERV